MYDHVDLCGGVVQCPSCGDGIESISQCKHGGFAAWDPEPAVWQTKQGDCELLWVPWWDVEQFHTHCSHCKRFIDMHVEGVYEGDVDGEVLGLRSEYGKPPVMHHEFVICDNDYHDDSLGYKDAMPVTWLALPQEVLG